MPFFHLSASEFIEMIVGVGASRVRDLFDQAKKAAPSIIFIDELDAIGRTRGAGMTLSGHDEREQTLNQILTEMDGITGNEGGADLKTLVTEAALLAAKRRHDRVTMRDFTDALEKVVLGTARHLMLTPEEKERTAYHESGHALPGMITPGADRVRTVSIVPRGRALGATFQSPEIEKHGHSGSYLRGRITGALGGQAAEEIVYGDVTRGGESDLDHVTLLARPMPTRQQGCRHRQRPHTTPRRRGTKCPGRTMSVLRRCEEWSQGPTRRADCPRRSCTPQT